MDQKSYQLGGILLLAISLVSGCASTNTASDDSMDEVLEVTVLNQTQRRVTAFVQWETGARLRLGELRGGANRTFIIPLRGAAFRLGLDVLASPPSNTATPATTRRRGRPVTFAPVQPGDRIEWEISPTFELSYRFLTPR